MTMPTLFGDEMPAASRLRTEVAQTQSLYRKYRPQSFNSAELVGQEHIVRTLRNAIQLGRVAHAYLFCGPRGTGKTTTARLLAKAVNCLDQELMNRPCNACTSCLAISTGATSDVIEIDAASNRGIDDIRDLRERVKYAPTQLKTKFYIIDEAHQITGAAANAFLKTLEEPPPHTKFVLATTDPEELLPTIVSRCQRFDFRRIGLDAMDTRLRGVAEAEGLNVTDDAFLTIARHATGSLRDALGLLDQLAVYGDTAGDDQITGALVLSLLGVSRNDRVERLVTAIADKNAGDALGTVNESVEAGEDPRQLNRQLVAYLRVLLHERAGGSPDADERAKALAQRFDLPELGRLGRLFSETDYKIRHSPYAQLPLEIALVDAIVGLQQQATPLAKSPSTATTAGATEAGRQIPSDDSLMASPPTTNLKDRLRQPNRGSHLQVVSPQSPITPEPVQPPTNIESKSPKPTAIREAPGSGGELTVEQLADLWPQIRQDVKAVNRRIEALLASIDPTAIVGNQIILSAAYDFHRKRLNEDEVRTVVEDAISRVVGYPVTIQCVMRGDVPYETPLSAPAAPTRTEGAAVEPVGAGDVAPTFETDAIEVESPTDASDIERDRQRLQAAKNIFDAEEIPN